jgi:penicillin-binding protein 2
MMRFSFSKKRTYQEIAPDEIFLDSKNLPEFNTQQFEGRLEKPINHTSIMAVLIFFACIVVVFSIKLFSLQIIKGEEYFAKSEKNSLQSITIFADRGIIYDRNMVELAWNERLKEDDPFAIRKYIKTPGFAHLLGYVAYPQEDDSGNFWQQNFIGKDGVEKVYGKFLEGKNGARLFEKDVKGNIHSEQMINNPERGKDLLLTVDANVQEGLQQGIADLAQASGYRGGGGVIMNIQTGEILALTSYPEYNSEILSLGEDREKINHYITDSRRVFINRVVSGVYTPGSIVKPYIALAALHENVIDPFKSILSTGQLVIENKYSPGNDTIFKDNKAHGYVDMRHALAVSSNVYFYQIGGGFKDQKGLGINNIEKYTKEFGLNKKTGIDLPNELAGNIPSIDWKKKVFPNDPWRVGDTYHTAIGQYGFQVTPIEMVRAVAAVANGGTLVNPHVLKEMATTKDSTSITIKDEKNYKVVREGMRMVVTDGTGGAVKLPFVTVAAKSGTAQVGISKSQVNSWITGFFPYENPKYAFVILMERGRADDHTSASHAMKYTLEWMNMHAPEYLR